MEVINTDLFVLDITLAEKFSRRLPRYFQSCSNIYRFPYMVVWSRTVAMGKNGPSDWMDGPSEGDPFTD
jgi:hypothetical protein